MSAEVSIAQRAEQDLTLQYRWYLENADVAERYLLAAHQTILRIAERPDLGTLRRFRALELIHVRSIQARRPFDRHLIFYTAGNPLRIERVMHGARDLPNRLLEAPGE
jgi:toxin ParE1/3/4